MLENMSSYNLDITPVLQSQDLKVDQEKESCIGFIQENWIENSVQDYLPCILKAP